MAADALASATLIGPVAPRREASAAYRSSGKYPDGLEAVQKASELRADLILLNSGLPRLNGIDVARQIRALVPESSIIFVTQESSADVMQEALSLDARGSVVKNKAGTNLVCALEAVLLGQTFVSSTEANHDFVEPLEAQIGQIPTARQTVPFSELRSRALLIPLQGR